MCYNRYIFFYVNISAYSTSNVEYAETKAINKSNKNGKCTPNKKEKVHSGKIERVIYSSNFQLL